MSILIHLAIDVLWVKNKVLDRSDILENTTIVEPNFADERKNGKV